MSARGGGRRHYLDRRTMGESQRLAVARRNPSNANVGFDLDGRGVARASGRHTASGVIALPHSRKARAVAEGGAQEQNGRMKSDATNPVLTSEKSHMARS